MDTFEWERDTNLMEYWSSMYEPRYVKNKIRSIKIVKSLLYIKKVCEAGVFKPIVLWSSEVCCYRCVVSFV